MNDKDTSSYFKIVIFNISFLNISSPSQSEIPFLSSKYKQKNSRLFYKSRLSFYNSSSPIRRSSTTACERPLTPSFCIAFEMCSICKNNLNRHIQQLKTSITSNNKIQLLLIPLLTSPLSFPEIQFKLLLFLPPIF